MTDRDGGSTKIDRRVRRTQTALQGALIRLVEERELSQISVADVADRAEVSRSAFYDHYRDVHELAEVACTAMIDDLIASLPALDREGAVDLRDPVESLRAFFANLADYVGLYRSLLGPQGSARVIEHVRRRITATVHDAECHGADPGLSHVMPAAFTAGALIGVATEWLQRGCPGTPAEMAALTWPLLAALHRPGPDEE
ncbi:TetR/AcrR family transcriptional regulator [Nonomuraea sp. NPDC050404]|uniref:TetR/AcrR family transcriptional regulator n=1 Tax=Nonomuraea sp. NPDC050404 TaxID=3155783 RepID=UPI0033D67BBD